MRPSFSFAVAALIVPLASAATTSCGTTGSTNASAADGGGDDDAGVYDPHPDTPPWLSNAHVFVNGHGLEDQRDCRANICRHNENVDMIAWNGATYMVHRTARSQILGDNSALHIYRSTDSGVTFTDVATLPAITGRDLRDPAFFVVGSTLFMKALTRLPVDSVRDSNVDTVTVITTTTDGVTWTPFVDAAPHGQSFWRVKENGGTYYSAAYADGDQMVTLFSSKDGRAWTKGAQIYGVSADTPLETELVFMPSGKLLALVRMDGTDAELLANDGRLRTKVCWADAPYTTFTCPQELSPYRLDGPVALFWQKRLFVIARKHIEDETGRKRTALYELGGTLDGGPLTIKEIGELPSAGDTSYAGIAMIDDHRAVVHWYAGDIYRDEAWVLAMFNITDIWQGTIDFSKL
jgi:hypothetical protein